MWNHLTSSSSIRCAGIIYDMYTFDTCCNMVFLLVYSVGTDRGEANRDNFLSTALLGEVVFKGYMISKCNVHFMSFASTPEVRRQQHNRVLRSLFQVVHPEKVRFLPGAIMKPPQDSSKLWTDRFWKL